jgi:hypothetical protein
LLEPFVIADPRVASRREHIDEAVLDDDFQFDV